MYCVVPLSFSFWYMFLWAVLQNHHKKNPMNSDIWGSLYTSVTSSLYLSRNFRRSTVAGIRTMTPHGFLVHNVLLGSFGIAMMLIALQFLRLFQVSTLWCDLFLVEDDPLHEILIWVCFDRENIEWISTFVVTFQSFILLRWPISAIVMVAPYSTIKLVIHFGTFLV